jgi:ribosome-binding protein aMBF1 (putative translation factor)
MSVRTKTPRTETTRFNRERRQAAPSDSIPWIEAFPGLTDNDIPGHCLVGARYKEGLTQVQLAKLTGIPQRHISEMENGKRTIGRQRAKQLADVLNVNYRIFL